MAHRDIIVIGGSAGGVEALLKVVERFPADLAAAVFVVVHIAPYAPSTLPKLLSNRGPLEARHPEDGEIIRHGRIYIAPPDHHMLLERDRVIVRRGPKENRFRPSIDALFRSAAYVHRTRVIGVVLSGVLDDGTSGLWTIKYLGGMSVIQNPEDAQHPEMPSNALSHVPIDRICDASDIAALLTSSVTETVTNAHEVTAGALRRIGLEVDIAGHDGAFEKGVLTWGDMSPFSCPECHGVLVKLEEGKLLRFRCHTGHCFTPSALLSAIGEAVEATLWQAMRGLEEQAVMLEHMTKHFEDFGLHGAAKRFKRKADQTREHAQVVHDSLPVHEQLSQDSGGED